MANHRSAKRFSIRRRFLSKSMRKLFSQKLLKQMHGPFWRRALFNWERAFERLLPLGGASEGNHGRIFTDGDKAILAMRDAIAKAQRRVWMETYIFEPDGVGTLIKDALTEAARRGCEVILIYDHFGSPRMGVNFLTSLIAAGGRALAFNPIWPWRKRGPLLFRNHRKILIIDDCVGFCGSMNISLEYAGKSLGTGRFRDTVLQLEGPCIKDLSNLFLSSLRETTGEDRSIYYRGKRFSDGVFAQVLGSNTRRNLYAIQRSLEETLSKATRFCYFTTPYFLPYEGLRKAMIDAAQRGVDVRVLTAGLSDVPLMRLASQGVYGQFLKAGIRIYEMFGKTLHAKVATIDGIYSTVGSYNLDHWSARRNLEVNVSMVDASLASKLKQQFDADLKFAKEVTMAGWDKRGWVSRVLQWLAYQLMRF